MPADTPSQEQLAIWEIANAPGISADSILTRTDLIKLWIRRYRLPRFIVHTMQSGRSGEGPTMMSAPSPPTPVTIYVDADACPVKQEVYRVAGRHGVKVVIVSNSPIAVPREPQIERVVVAAGMDEADNWIAERANPGSIVITADIPLASRCVKTGAAVIAPNGKAFTEESIGMTLATRNLMDALRSAGEITGGPKSFAPRDRSSFLSALDRAIVRLKRAGFG